MWKFLLTALFFISMTLVVINSYVVSASAQTSKELPPPPPTWIDADRKLKLDKAPREVPAIGVGSDGKAYEKMVPSHMDAVPPAPLR